MIMNETTSNMNDEQVEFSNDFKHFLRFSTRALPTNRPTDRASNRGAMAHLKREENQNGEKMFNVQDLKWGKKVE